MLEYNADTPSLILESGILSEDWFNTKGAKLTSHQSNYITQIIPHVMTQIKKECPSTAFVFVLQDVESSA